MPWSGGAPGPETEPVTRPPVVSGSACFGARTPDSHVPAQALGAPAGQDRTLSLIAVHDDSGRTQFDDGLIKNSRMSPHCCEGLPGFVIGCPPVGQ